jgi:hypothetical protein
MMMRNGMAMCMVAQLVGAMINYLVVAGSRIFLRAAYGKHDVGHDANFMFY